MLGWLLGFLWLAALKAWLGCHLALDGDALLVPDFWNSLHTGGHLGNWAMGPQPYLFPDVLIYGLSAHLCQDPLSRQICYGLILGFLLWCFLARLMKRLWNVTGSSARAYSAAGLLLLLPCLNGLNGLDGALVPGYHGGALLCGMAFLTWAAGQEIRSTEWSAVLWASFLIGITWASDQIVPAWVLLPALILSLGLNGRARRGIWAAAALSAVVRYGALWYWKSSGMQVAHFQWSYFEAHWDSMLEAFRSQTWDALTAPSPVAFMAVLAVVLLLLRFKTRPLVGWYAVSLAVLALSAFGVSALEGSFTGRYFIGFIWLSVPMLPLELSKRLDGQALPLVAAGLIGLMGLIVFKPLPSPVYEQVQWVDAQLAPRGLTVGLADYNYARQLSVLSGGSLRVAPAIAVSGRLEPYLWMVDRRVFSAVHKAQFVLVGALDPRAIRAALGPPSDIVHGQGVSLWIYSKPAASRTP